MSISRRTARTVRILGVASASTALALGVAGNALACNIRDFSAVASCDNGKGSITVTDTDASGKEATVTVYLESNGADEKKVGTETVKGTREGATVTFAEDWAPKAQYRIHIDVPGLVNEDVSPTLTTSAEGCAKETPAPSGTPTPSATPTPSETPSDSDSATPSAEESSSTAPAAVTDNAPSAAAGESNLAETGADSNTPMIAGIAGALVVVGGGAVFFGMRRRGASKAN
ncbi:LAETG motif-containing sortase-dependent surface protein [Streptomyces sp. NPDC007084]|uniref:LAETG motif-containing sortase-dependent surface protein n=1 Tax=Streptomyces sp. NPDC007084 TaxID=3154313 RepID=UPI0034560459